MLARLRAILATVANGSKQFGGLLSFATIAALLGVVLIAYGLWQVYTPLAFIVPGVGLTWFALWLAGMFTRTG